MADPDFIELDEVGRTKAYFAGMDAALFGSFYGTPSKTVRPMNQLSADEQKEAFHKGEIPSPLDAEVKSNG